MRARKIRIMVVDDHPVVREGLLALLKMEPDLEVVTTANDGAEAMARVKQYQPDVMLLDLRMPRLDGLKVIAEIRAQQLKTRVIVMTAFENEADVHQALTAGARGYLLKGATGGEIVEAVRRVHQGQTCLLPSVVQKMVDSVTRPELSAREQAVLELLAEGMANKEIGATLKITEGTVKTHVKSLLKKLGVSGRAGAAREAMRRGLIRVS